MIEIEPDRFEEMVVTALDGLPEELDRVMANVAVTRKESPTRSAAPSSTKSRTTSESATPGSTNSAGKPGGPSAKTGVKTEAVDLRTAERCLHDRSGAAFAAAAEAGLPGRFRAFEHDGLLALLTTSPGLGFLNSVCGLTSESLDALPGVLAVFSAAGAPLPRLATDGPALAGRLRRLGFGPTKPRPVATTDLPPRRAFPAEPHGFRLTEARTPEQERVFLDTLTAGYEAPPELSSFLRAEHCAGGMRRFVAWQGPQPVAAAAFSMHGHVAVLGGAATVPAARRSGAQVALLHHRLNEAAAAGADAATATAAAESASVRNLARIGFEIRYRPGWEWLPAAPQSGLIRRSGSGECGYRVQE